MSRSESTPPPAPADEAVQIGELSRRTGVSHDLLRVWERRYGLLQPTRTTGGFRLYSADDERRVSEMRDWLAQGIPASVAAQLVLGSSPALSARSNQVGPSVLRADLQGSLDAFDEGGANAVLDQLFASFSLRSVLDGAVLPYLHELGARWEAGNASIAQEHFATGVLRGRLLGLSRNWGLGTGAHALLACPSDEYHDLGLIAFGLALRELGWRITCLGTNTPLATLADAADRLSPEIVVISGLDPSVLQRSPDELCDLCRHHHVAISHTMVADKFAETAGATVLQGGPVAAAERVAAEHASSR